MKSTDIGRKMYGGGGITPDEKFEAAKPTHVPAAHLQLVVDLPFRFHVLWPGEAVAAAGLGAGRRPDGALQGFPAEQRDFTFTDAEFDHDKKWLTEQIRDEFYLRAFDKKTSDRAQFVDDPEVQKAVENLPKAETMLSEAQKVMAAQ